MWKESFVLQYCLDEQPGQVNSPWLDKLLSFQTNNSSTTHHIS